MNLLHFILLSSALLLQGAAAFAVEEISALRHCRFTFELFATIDADSMDMCRLSCQMMENCQAFNWDGKKCEVTDQKFERADAVDVDDEAAFCGIVANEETRASGRYH